MTRALPSVFGAAQLFFQVSLLVGYGIAAVLAPRLVALAVGPAFLALSTTEVLIADTAYGSGTNLVGAAARDVEVLAPVHGTPKAPGPDASVFWERSQGCVGAGT